MASLGGKPSKAIQDLRDEAKRATKDFSSLAGSFESSAKGTEKLKTESNGAMLALKGFVTLELAKKAFAFADATLRSAKSMDTLSKSTKEGAVAYSDMMDNTIGIAKNMLIWGASLAPIKGTMETLSNLAKGISLAFESSADATTRLKTQSDTKWAEFLKTDEGKKVSLSKSREEVRRLAEVANQKFADTYFESSEARKDKANKKAMDALTAYNKLASDIGMPEDVASTFLRKSGMSVDDLLRTSLAKAELSKNKPEKEKTVKELDWAKIRSDRLDALASLLDENQAIVDTAKQQELDYQKWHTDIKKAQAEQDKALAKDIAETEMSLRKKAQDEQLLSMQAGFGATAQMAGALSQLATVSAGKNKEMAKNALTLSEVVAIANVAEGVTKAFAQGGVLGFVTGGAVGIAGLAQIATIEQQKQKLADGGIIRGPSTGDTVPVMANGGEMMLTKADQSNLLSMVRGGGNGGNGITYAPVINSSNPAQVKQMLRENKSEFASFVMSVMRDPSNSRARAFA